MKINSSAETTEKKIAITFDDGPDENKTRDILEILNKQQIPAAFFLIGRKILGNEIIIKEIISKGHIVCNHSYSHSLFFDLFSSKRMLTELKQTDAAIQNVVNLKPILFRPPYGVMNPNLKKAIISGKYQPVGWNVRSFDTVIKNEQKLLKRMEKALRPGAVFLFHDTSKEMISILPAFLAHVKANGYNVVRVDKLLNLQPYA